MLFLEIIIWYYIPLLILFFKEVKFNFQAVFVDSYAKMPSNINDELQQEAFTRETAKLWEYTTNFTSFPLRTLEVM